MTDNLQKKINDKQIRFIEDGIPSRWDEKSVTHDELPYIAIIEDLNKLIRKEMKAINAVMELHKFDQWGEECKHCDNGSYPCETIKAIEKELG
jgi:hypothetical protein